MMEKKGGGIPLPGRIRVKLREVWVHTCPIHGEEECLAGRTNETQTHQCRHGAETRLMTWQGTSTRIFRESKIITREKIRPPVVQLLSIVYTHGKYPSTQPRVAVEGLVRSHWSSLLR